jgi:hypothetical protein
MCYTCKVFFNRKNEFYKARMICFGRNFKTNFQWCKNGFDFPSRDIEFSKDVRCKVCKLQTIVVPNLRKSL